MTSSWISPAACATCASSPRAAGWREARSQPNRLYVLESTPTITGTMADERLSAPPDRIAAVLRRLGGAAGEKLDAREEAFAQKLAADLAEAPRVVAGA